MNTSDRISVQFKDRDAFGDFCISLRDDDVSFSLAGFQTIVLAQSQLDQLPVKSANLFKESQDRDLVKISLLTVGGQRPPHITPEEAKELLRQYTEELKSQTRTQP